MYPFIQLYRLLVWSNFKQNPIWLKSDSLVATIEKQRAYRRSDFNQIDQKSSNLEELAWFLQICSGISKKVLKHQILPFRHWRRSYHISSHILRPLSSPSFKTLTIYWGVVVSIGLVSWLKKITTATTLDIQWYQFLS